MELVIKILVLLIFFLITSFLNKKKKRPSSGQPLPPIRRPQQQPEPGKKTLDYMIKGSKVPSPETVIVAPPPLAKPKLKPPVSPENTYRQPDTVAASHTLAATTSAPVNISLPSAPVGNISTPAAKPMDIDRAAMMKAFMYTAVLTQPKSVKYLERFGIQRFPTK